jgi:hypothetical protein
MGGLCQHLEIEALRLQLSQWEGVAWRHALADPSEAAERVATVSSGCPALDRILPDHGFRPGTLVEWLTSGPGDGATTFAFRTAVKATNGDGAVVVVDASGEFYPPAAIALGLEPSRLIVVHPGSPADHTWALDQALRCPAVAAAVAWPDCRLSLRESCATFAERKATNSNSHQSINGGTRFTRPTLRSNGKFDGRVFRRLQLAAEQGGGLGLLIRPATVRGEPSWADVRLLIEPSREVARRRIRIVLLRSRGGFGERAVEVEINDESHLLHQAR